jgi:hypothetical protein
MDGLPDSTYTSPLSPSLLTSTGLFAVENAIGTEAVSRSVSVSVTITVSLGVTVTTR